MTTPADAIEQSNRAFDPGAFTASESQQHKFVDRVVQKRFARPDIAVRGWLIPGAAAALQGVGAAALIARGEARAAVIAGLVAAGTASLAWQMWRMQQLKSAADTAPDSEAAYRDADGLLTPVLDDGERVIARLKPDAKQARLARAVSGALQSVWGVLLAGIAVAVVLGRGGDVPQMMMWLMGAIAVGSSLLFGRGVRDLFGLAAAETLVVTNQRLVAIAAPGALQSMSLEHLTNRPIVVGREDGRATIALALGNHIATARLPVRVLWGQADVDDQVARQVAHAVVDARLTLLRKRLEQA